MLKWVFREKKIVKYNLRYNGWNVDVYLNFLINCIKWYFFKKEKFFMFLEIKVKVCGCF